MTRTIINAPEVFRPSTAYSHAVKSGGLVFVSGIMPHGPDGKIVGETIGEQAAQCLTSISTILKAAGTSLDKAVSATIILAEDPDMAGLNAEWIKWFPSDPPARQGARLPIVVPGLKISIAMVVQI